MIYSERRITAGHAFNHITKALGVTVFMNFELFFRLFLCDFIMPVANAVKNSFP